MTFTSKFIATVSLLTLVACSPSSSGEAERSGNWTLSPLESSMSYVTIKNGNVGEVNTFSDISGVVTSGGQAEFNIALDSVQTYNETRDPRMKKYVFETDKFAQATVSADINMTQFNVLGIGNSKSLSVPLSFDLHGITEQKDVDLLVTRLGANKVRIANKGAILIDAEDFGFEAGLAKLQELAKLNSISPVVSATVSLTFER